MVTVAAPSPDSVRNASAWSFVADAVGAFPGSAERLLRDAAERAARNPQGRMALVLHLSQLRPPAPRRHHERIARAILQEAAQRREGQLFALRNGDLVLICRMAPDVLVLPEMLGRLLHLDVPDSAAIVSAWRLEQSADLLLAYATTRLADRTVGPAVQPAPPAAVSPLALDTLEAALRQARWPDITHRQTGVLLAASSFPQAGLQPLFRELTVTLAALDPPAEAAGAVSDDPYLAGQFAPRLDAGLLAALADALGKGGPLDAADPLAPRLHLNLAVPSLVSPAFFGFAQRCRDTGKALGVEITLAAASADPAAFAQARRAAQAAGCTLVLDGVSHLALLLTRPWALRPDLVKLDWSPLLADLPRAEQTALEAALQAIGPARLMLQGADDEAALRWGFAHGIRRFQGRHVDLMLAAERMLSCPAAAGCTLRQCVERAAATGPVGRQFCRRPDLLDAGVPPLVANAAPP